MSEADKLLDSLDEGENNVVEEYEEPHIVINEDRSITVPPELKEIAVQFDHDVETVTFDCPRWWDGHDMFNMNIHINYMTPDGKVHYYIARDKVLDKGNENIMHFAWTFSRNVTEVKGSIKFLVCIKNVNAEGEEVNHWNSKLNTDLYILEGLESDTAEIIDKYPDIIEGLLKRMDDLEEIGLSTKIDIEELNHNGRRVNKVIITSSSGVKEFIVTDGVDFIPHVSAEGELSWTNDKGLENPAPVNVRGATFTPSVDEQGNISWTNDKGLENPETVNVRGATFTPSVDGQGDISWTNDKGLENPETVNVRGPAGAMFTPVELDENGVASVFPQQAYRIKAYAKDPIVELFADLSSIPYSSINGARNVIGDKIYFLSNKRLCSYDIQSGVYAANLIDISDADSSYALCTAVGSTIYIFDAKHNYGLGHSKGRVHGYNTQTGEGYNILDDGTDYTAPYMLFAVVEDKIYLLYTLKYNSTTNTYDMSVFDTTTNTFNLITVNTSMPSLTETEAGDCIVIDKKIYIFDHHHGQSNPVNSDSIMVFDTENNTFNSISVSSPVTECGVASMGKKIFLFGGHPRNNFKYQNTIIEFDTETEQFKTLDTVLPYKARSLTALSINNAIYLFGGQDAADYSNPITNYYMYKFTDVTVNCDLTLKYTSGEYVFDLIGVYDEYCDHFLFEILALRLTDSGKTLKIAYELNGKRTVETLTNDTEFNLSTCELRISGAESVLKYNTDSSIPLGIVVDTEFIGTDENGGRIYKVTFDNGSSMTFTAPKGKDSEVEVVRLL